MIRHLLVIVSAICSLTFAFAAPALAAHPYPVNFNTFGLSSGAADGVTLTNGSLHLSSSNRGSTYYLDLFANANSDGVDGSGYYDYGTWTSGDYTTDFAFNELVSSWNAQTPVGTWVQSEVQPQLADGHWAKWYTLGQWAYGDSDFHRTSVGHQGDADGYVSIDTFLTKDHPAIAYRLRLTLYRRAGSTATPTVSRYSAVASNLSNQKNTFPSPSTMPAVGHPIDLEVPQYSQEIHRGEFPQFDNGGEAWCSPTSTAMVVGYWASMFPKAGYSPSATETSAIPYADPWVDYTARYVFDYHYDGAGNWPFNTAYAAGRGLVADVTQLHNLREAEPFIQAGIPLVASIAFTSNKLDTAIKSTNGHLAVIEGFTADGSKVIVNDPASATNADVKHYYDRAQFERAWIPASGGIVYVDRPVGWPTPPLDANNS
jgi:hypothetical protein